MSPTPIREAVRLLQADGLLLYRPHHGIVVTELSSSATEDVYRLRLLLEPLATELGVAELSLAGVDELERLQARLATASSESIASVSEANRAWHWAIYAGSTSPILNDFIRRLWDSFPWRTVWGHPVRMAISLRQHDSIMEAIRNRNATQAAELMREHIETGKETVLNQVRRELAEHS